MHPRPNLRFASTFLSHSTHDKPLVEQVALRLARRGVLAWLDTSELGLGPLDSALKQAVQQQATMTIFLSKDSVRSEWCRDECRWAIEASSNYTHLLPVYLGDPLALVRAHELLCTRFLHPDGDRVNQLGVVVDPNNPDLDGIADAIARAVYRRVIGPTWSEVAVILDQRGKGPRRGVPPISPNVASLEIPALLFRPSLADRDDKEVVPESEWDDVAACLKWGLHNALGTLRGDRRKVRVFGETQTSLMWLVGRHLDRTNEVDLYVYGRQGALVSNKGQEDLRPLVDGTPRALPVGTSPSGTCEAVAIGVGNPRYQGPAKAALPAQMPLLWLECGKIDDSRQAMTLVSDLVATVDYLRQEHQIRHLKLFWATANHVAPLAAANLTTHVISTIDLLEWDHNESKYLSLPVLS